MCSHEEKQNIVYNVRRAIYHLKVEYKASQTPVSEGFIIGQIVFTDYAIR